MGVKNLIKIFLCLIFVLNLSAHAETVRVSISDNKFQVFEYEKLTVFGTSLCNIYDKKEHNLLLSVPQDTPIELSMSGGFLYLNVGEDHISLMDTIVIDCPNGLLGVQNLKRKGIQALYRGDFEIIKNQKSSKFFLVNVIDLQDYLKGVVPNEMPVRFGLEALKAQSVAARNYVLSPRTKAYKEFDVGDSVASQVYFGANTEEILADRAVTETEGLVAIYNWELILAQYSSTAGGYTESFENVFSEPYSKLFPSLSKPYLKAKADMIMQQPLLTEEDVKIFYTTSPDSYDMKSPYYRWTKEWSVDELEAVLKKTLVTQSKTGFVQPALKNSDDFGKLKSLKVKKRGDSGKAIELEILTDKGSYSVLKELVIRRTFQKDGISLPSANIVFDTETPDLIKIYGGGYGHGVGMSQYGAGFMGDTLKMPFDKILKHYYSGVSITTTPVILSSYDSQNTITQKFYFNNKMTANLVVDNRFNISKINMIINEQTIEIPLANTTENIKNPIHQIDISKHLKKGENAVTFCYPPQEGRLKAVRLYIKTVSKDDSRFGF